MIPTQNDSVPTYMLNQFSCNTIGVYRLKNCIFGRIVGPLFIFASVTIKYLRFYVLCTKGQFGTKSPKIQVMAGGHFLLTHTTSRSITSMINTLSMMSAQYGNSSSGSAIVRNHVVLSSIIY